MTASAIERHSGVRYFSVAATDAVALDSGNGGSVLEGIRVFRSGTFRDSNGTQHTWELEHLQQMEFNFRMLRDRGLFPNVPVRADHTLSVNSVVGYVADLRVEDTFLVADLEITEPDAIQRWNRGTYRARSLEVGMYETNDESVYWPVVMGVAFVDIPAVEGLHRRPASDVPNVFATHTEETTLMPDENSEQDATTTTAPVEDPPPAPDEEEGETEDAPPAPGEPTPEPAPATEPAPEGQHARAMAFALNGQRTQDPRAVQAHIDALERFQRETRDENRRAFVRDLAGDHKIAATQIDSLTTHALSLDESQWQAFTNVYESAPSLRLFGEFGNGVTNPDGEPTSDEDEASVLEETVAMHRRSGMSEDQIQQTASYRKLEALRAATR